MAQREGWARRVGRGCLWLALCCGVQVSLAGCDALQGATGDKSEKPPKKKKSKKKESDESDGDVKAASGFKKAQVPAGESDGVWTAAFRVERLADDAGKSYLDAAAACRDANLALCSEVQWKRACESDASLGALESWTASWDGDAVVVRGGSDCSARKTASGAEGDAKRAGVCCERTIGVKTANKNASFVAKAHADQLRFENALNAQDINALSGIYGKGLFMEGNPDKGMTNDAAVKAQKSWFATHPKQWTIYDTCDAAVADIVCPTPGKRLECPGLVMDCTMVQALGDELTVVKQRVGWWKDDDEPNNHVWDIRHGKRIRKLGKL